MPNGLIGPQTIVRLLSKIVYAGYVEAPAWGVSARKGNHPPLISLSTYQKNQQRLKDGVYVPTRKDIKEDFPLRGAVCCSSCQTPLTAGWSKGKYNKYPYYFCRTKGCDAYGKTIARDKIESAFQDVLRDVQLSETLACMAVQLFKDIWDQQAQNAEAVQ